MALTGEADTHENWRGAGINIPLFSIRSENDWGIGDLAGLRKFCDYGAHCGMKLVQLLPINDTAATFTEKDSYPYSAISAFAADPKYLDVPSIAKKTATAVTDEEHAEIRRLNSNAIVQHTAARALKMIVLRKCFEKDSLHFLQKKSWQKFLMNHGDWLLPYASFCVLRDENGTADYKLWPEQAQYSKNVIERRSSPAHPSHDKFFFYCWLQFLLHKQLTKAKRHAKKRGILLKADLPIGVGRNSADTWQFPELFNLDMQAGAPPDAFSAKGQNWGFPTYNMAAMKANNYDWFRRRMKHLEHYFDAVRIDHVLGFFRIWSIPFPYSDGRLGRFVPAIALKGSDFQDAGIDFDEKRFCEPFADDIADVILIKANREFHFRIDMQQTQSFAALSAGRQERLSKLYDRYFFEMQNALWEKEGRERLAILRDSTSMLLCAEDLGMVPAFTESVLHGLGILSLQVQQMPKHGGDKFSFTEAAPEDCVVMPATHDMLPVRAWWEVHHTDAQLFLNSVLHVSGTAPYFCEPWICKRNVQQHLASPARWSIFLLHEILAMSGDVRRTFPLEERINDPADPAHVWNYRMHLTIEDLAHHKKFTKSIKKMVRESGR